jgi:Family of unknown function (DUF6644)
MSAVQMFANWLKTTHLSAFVTQSRWVWPASETLHFVGLAMLIGVVGLMDLRLLGMAKRLPFAPLHKLLPFGIAGFSICLGTGILFFSGDPFQYIHNPVFWYKLLFIVLAGVNVLVFYVSGVFHGVEHLAAGEDAPLGAKLIAGASLLLWIGVMYLGRMLPFLGDAF